MFLHTRAVNSSPAACEKERDYIMLVSTKNIKFLLGFILHNQMGSVAFIPWFFFQGLTKLFWKKHQFLRISASWSWWKLCWLNLVVVYFFISFFFFFLNLNSSTNKWCSNCKIQFNSMSLKETIWVSWQPASSILLQLVFSCIPLLCKLLVL